MNTVLAPPEPFDPEEFVLQVGAPIFRVFSTEWPSTSFNPTGPRGVTRFATFGEPSVPVLYAAQSERAAVCESILHDVPVAGGSIGPREYRARAMCLLRPARDLRLASFMGTGLRRLGVRASDLTDTPASQYVHTVAWAEAAHAAGYDGAVWMSNRCNTDEAYVLFGDRVGPSDLVLDESYARAFSLPVDLDWLVDFCVPFRVDVLLDGV